MHLSAGTQDRGVGFPRAEVTVSCEPPGSDGGNQTAVSAKAACALSHKPARQPLNLALLKISVEITLGSEKKT